MFGKIKKQAETPKGLFFLILGDAKVGKTTFATTIQELGFTALVNFENRVAHIAETENLRIYPQSSTDERIDTPCTNEQLQELCRYINSNENHNIQSIIIDTADEWFDICKDEYLSKNKKSALSFEAREKIYDDILYIFKFLKKKQINVIMTCHVKKDEETGKMSSQLPAKLKRKINQLTDFIFFLDVTGNGERIIHTGNNPVFSCGQSMPAGKELPDSIKNPTFKQIMEYYKNGN